MPAYLSARKSQARHYAALLLTVLVASFAMLATSAVVAPDADAASKRKVRHAMNVAKNQLGDPYSYGADGPSSFDCSGLFYYAFAKRSGVSIPRTSTDQAQRARDISKNKMRKGDLMFFRSGGDVYHMGMFVGWKHGKRIVLHSPSTGESVKRDPVWTRHWTAGTMRG